MSRWTATDDDGHVMTIEVVAGSLLVTLPMGDGRFRTSNPEVARDVRRKFGLAVGQMAGEVPPS